MENIFKIRFGKASENEPQKELNSETEYASFGNYATTARYSNPDDLAHGETFEHWGIRICGKVSGSESALPPFLHRVYNYCIQAQVNNQVQQKASKIQIESDISIKQAKIQAVENNIDDTEKDISKLESKIFDKQNEKKQIEADGEKVNKEQKLRLIIGLVVIIPLTLYLFTFYSSTFYSAFFRDPSTMAAGVGNAMFDGQAIPHAFKDGLFELGFVLLAPVIFLALGVLLNSFASKRGVEKYVPIAALLLLTLSFDSILAFKIGNQLHEYGIMIGLYPIRDPYTVGKALEDINTWAVIFCGFVVYVMWGLLFNMTINAYNNLDFRKVELVAIDDEVEAFEQQISKKQSDKTNLKKEKETLQSEVSKLQAKLNGPIVDSISIKKEMNNFLTGWVTQLKTLLMNDEALKRANAVYIQTIKELNLNNDEK